MQDKDNQNKNNKTFQSIFDDFNKEKEVFPKQEENVISDEVFAEREIIQEKVKEQIIEPKEVEKEPKILTKTETNNWTKDNTSNLANYSLLDKWYYKKRGHKNE